MFHWSIFVEKIIHKSSSSKHTISLCCTLFKVWLLSLGAEYYIFVAKNAYFKLSELVSQISFTKSYYRESCSLLEIFMTVFEKKEYNNPTVFLSRAVLSKNGPNLGWRAA